MKSAGENAEGRGSEKIKVKDVEESLEKLKNLPKDIGSFV